LALILQTAVLFRSCPKTNPEPSLPSRVRLSLSDPERRKVELGMGDILITALRRPEIVEG
jgi:hypothetical protein